MGNKKKTPHIGQQGNFASLVLKFQEDKINQLYVHKSPDNNKLLMFL